MAATVAVHVAPKASKNQILGWTDSSPRELSVRVTVAPEGGKANKAVCQLVAESMNIAKSKVQIKRGQTSRHKMLEADISDEDFARWEASLPIL